MLPGLARMRMHLLAHFRMESVAVRQVPAMVPSPAVIPIVDAARRVVIDAHVRIIVVIVIAARPGAVSHASGA